MEKEIKFSLKHLEEPSVFGFYRAMQSYEKALGGDTSLILSPTATSLSFGNTGIIKTINTKA